MAQNPTICGVSVLICRTRVTRLDETGAVAAGPNNSYVSDKVMRVGLTPIVSEGKDIELKSGCDCIVAAYKAPNLLKRFDLELVSTALEAALQELLLGATLISDTSSVPVPIGVWWPAQVGCELAAPPNIAFEFWTKVQEGNYPSVAWPWLHHVYPFVNWSVGPQTYEDDFSTPTITGIAQPNPVWNQGPYGDQPDGIPGNSPGGWFYTSTVPPTAACGYASVTPGS